MSDETLRIRVIAPDAWNEKKVELARNTAVGAIKQQLLPELLGTNAVDPASYYVEYFEKEVLDESKTLADLDVPANGVISLRPYDVDHPRPFDG